MNTFRAIIYLTMLFNHLIVCTHSSLQNVVKDNMARKLRYQFSCKPHEGTNERATNIIMFYKCK